MLNSILYWMTVWAWLNFWKSQNSKTIVFIYNWFQKFIHKHSSGRRNQMYPEAMFSIPERHSKCTFYYLTFGISFIQQFNGIWRRIFSTIFWSYYGNQRCTHTNKHLHGFAGNWIKKQVRHRPQTHLTSSF